MNRAATLRTSVLLTSCLLASPLFAGSPSYPTSLKATQSRSLAASIWRALEELFPVLSEAMADSEPDGTNSQSNGQSPAPSEPDRGAGMDPWG